MGQVGRPKLFKSKKDLQAKLEAYREYCEGRELKDAAGNPVLDSLGQPIMINQHKPTVTGLARFLGMRSRQTLVNYGRDEQFGDIVCDARMCVEEYNEECLHDRNAARGAEFTLRCNFNWGAEPSGKNQDSINQDVLALAELINNPAPNRNITDFEGDTDE